MGRSKKSFDRLTRIYKYKDHAARSTRVPVLKEIGKLVMPPKTMTLTYIPVCEELEVPEGTVAPVSVIEHFINEASDHLILNRCVCRSENSCSDSTRTSGACSSALLCARWTPRWAAS